VWGFVLFEEKKIIFHKCWKRKNEIFTLILVNFEDVTLCSVMPSGYRTPNRAWKEIVPFEKERKFYTFIRL
jgi:hypothetical protein